MYTTDLLKVGGSVMLTIPPAFLTQLDLDAGMPVSIWIDDGRLILQPVPATNAALAGRVAQTEPGAIAAGRADVFMTSGPAGRELL